MRYIIAAVLALAAVSSARSEDAAPPSPQGILRFEPPSLAWTKAHVLAAFPGAANHGDLVMTASAEGVEGSAVFYFEHGLLSFVRVEYPKATPQEFEQRKAAVIRELTARFGEPDNQGLTERDFAAWNRPLWRLDVSYIGDRNENVLGFRHILNALLERSAAELLITDFSWKAEGGFVTALGRVKNATDRPLANVEAVVVYEDSSGALVSRETALIDFNPLAAGALSTFSVIGRSDPRIAKASVAFKVLGGGAISSARD